MNGSTMSKCVTGIIRCRKTYAVLALVGLIASLSGAAVVVVAAAADKAAEPPPSARIPGLPPTPQEEFERKSEAAQRETPEESVQMLFQDHFIYVDLAITSVMGGEAYLRRLVRDPRVAKLLDLAQNGSEEQRASLLAEVKKMCRRFIEQIPLMPESIYYDHPFTSTVFRPGGGIAYPLLLSVLDDKVETLPILLEMTARHQEALRKRNAEGCEESGEAGVGYEKANETYTYSNFGHIASYTCVKLLGKCAQTPALRSAVSSRQAQILADFAEFEETIPADGSRPQYYHFDEKVIFQFAQDFVQAAGK